MTDPNPAPEGAGTPEPDPGDAGQDAGKHAAAEASEAPAREWNTQTMGPKRGDRPGDEHETGI